MLITWTKAYANSPNVFYFFYFYLSTPFKQSTSNFFRFYSLIVSWYLHRCWSYSLVNFSRRVFILSTYFSFLLEVFWSIFFWVKSILPWYHLFFKCNFWRGSRQNLWLRTRKLWKMLVEWAQVLLLYKLLDKLLLFSFVVMSSWDI